MDIDNAKMELDECGYVVLPDLIPRDDALRLGERLKELTHEDGEWDGNGYRNLACLYNNLEPDEYESFLPLMTHPVLLELARYKLGSGFQSLASSVVIREPGVPFHGLHADVPLGWFPEEGLPIPRDACFLIQSNWMLTDFTFENGATQLLPMSHLMDPCNKWVDDAGNERYLNDRVRRLREEIEAGDPKRRLVTAEGSAGSAVVFHGAMWHRAGANTTSDQERVGVLSPYHPRWVEPGYGLGLPEALLRRSVRDRMPDQVQRMSLRVAEDYE